MTIEDLRSHITSTINGLSSLQELEEQRIRLFGKSGLVTQELKSLGSLNVDERKEKGLLLNQLKEQALGLMEEKKNLLETKALEEKLKQETLDLTLPYRPIEKGRFHPLAAVIREITTYFEKYGFEAAVGPEIEDDFHNFDALNVPPYHPARQEQDTFYLQNTEKLLRTHTSNVQIRTMKQRKPPLRILSVGRVYRSDAPDSTHLPMFHQLEGLAIDSVNAAEPLTLAHLKHLLSDFCGSFFDISHEDIRLRPSHFPFTEPSLEVDIFFKKGDKGSWLELLGCGMVHPNVLRNCGVDPEQYQGFAWGMGIERLAMIKYDITDIRHFCEHDKRWLERYGVHPFFIS